VNTKLQTARKASGKTQKQVAEECGISNTIYQSYEYNIRTPSVRTAIRIATALNSTVEALFSGEKKGE
jgi:transcriptional regulator with XRE-family HTH domain